jgi:very-short-patch-repair endonuclease
VKPAEPLTPEQVKRAVAKAKRERLENKFEVQMKARGLGGYVRQHKFHPTRKWAFDFAFPEEKLAVEIEGGKWIRGRHQRPTGFQSDIEKYNEATRLGWRVLRFTGDDLNDCKAIDTVCEVLGD